MYNLFLQITDKLLVQDVGVGRPSSVTVWSHDDDVVDVESLVDLLEVLGKHRVYVDVPSQLRDSMTAGAGRIAPITTVVAAAGLHVLQRIGHL